MHKNAWAVRNAGEEDHPVYSWQAQPLFTEKGDFFREYMEKPVKWGSTIIHFAD